MIVDACSCYSFLLIIFPLLLSHCVTELKKQWNLNILLQTFVVNILISIAFSFGINTKFSWKLFISISDSADQTTWQLNWKLQALPSVIKWLHLNLKQRNLPLDTYNGKYTYLYINIYIHIHLYYTSFYPILISILFLQYRSGESRQEIVHRAESWH